MWKLYDKPKNAFGRKARTTPAVARARSGGQVASLILPESLLEADAADIYENGGRYLAYRQHSGGKFGVRPAGPKSRARKVTIPSKYAARIPFGITDCELTKDGDMLVLDLDQFTV